MADVLRFSVHWISRDHKSIAIGVRMLFTHTLKNDHI